MSPLAVRPEVAFARTPASAREPRWASLLSETCARLAERPEPAERNRLRGEAWAVLRTALESYARLHAGRLGGPGADSIQDVAADKALELLLRCESGAWDTRGWNGLRLAAFVSRVARNGVIDHLRALGPRRLTDLPGDESWVARPALRATAADNPTTPVEATEYADHLLKGLEALTPRARTVWFLRVCFDWPSRRIARYPGVQIKASHVDVELQRSRERIRTWMETRGFDVREMPPGTFAALWNECQRRGSLVLVADGSGESR